jgi:hypothetical protein
VGEVEVVQRLARPVLFVALEVVEQADSVLVLVLL